MITLPNILEVVKIDILIEKEFEIDCCIRGYHCFRSFLEGTEWHLLTGCKEDHPTSLVIYKYAIVSKNTISEYKFWDRSMSCSLVK